MLSRLAFFLCAIMNGVATASIVIRSFSLEESDRIDVDSWLWCSGMLFYLTASLLSLSLAFATEPELASTSAAMAAVATVFFELWYRKKLKGISEVQRVATQDSDDEEDIYGDDPYTVDPLPEPISSENAESKLVDN